MVGDRAVRFVVVSRLVDAVAYLRIQFSVTLANKWPVIVGVEMDLGRRTYPRLSDLMQCIHLETNPGVSVRLVDPPHFQ